jgi:hypothetical protein
MTQKKNLPTNETVEKQQSTSLQHIRHSEVFSGPLPPPEFLFGYKEVQDDFPERVIRYAEKDQDHRIDIERRTMGMAEKELIFQFYLAHFGKHSYRCYVSCHDCECRLFFGQWKHITCIGSHERSHCNFSVGYGKITTEKRNRKIEKVN